MTAMTQTTPSFSDIESEIKAILDSAEELDETSDDEFQLKVEAYLNALATQEARKIDGFALACKSLEARVDTLAQFIAQLQQKKKTLETRIKGLKGFYLKTMIEHQIKKVQGNAYTVIVRKSTSCEVNVSDEILQTFPSDFVKTTIEPRKSEIKKYLQEGGDLEGCRLVENHSISIR